MEKPIFIDNDKEIKIGKNFFSNIHFSFIGGCTVEIGDHVFIGPYCTLATGMHSLIAEELGYNLMKPAQPMIMSTENP